MISYVYMYAIFSDLEKLKKQVNNQHQQDTHLLLGRRLTLTLILTPGYRMGCVENAHPQELLKTAFYSCEIRIHYAICCDCDR